MQELIKVKVGMTAVILGIVGAGFGLGGVENSIETADLIASIGLALTSLMLMQVGVWMIKGEI